MFLSVEREKMRGRISLACRFVAKQGDSEEPIEQV